LRWLGIEAEVAGQEGLNLGVQGADDQVVPKLAKPAATLAGAQVDFDVLVDSFSRA